MRHIEDARALYGDIPLAPCPFTDDEVAELEATHELLVYLPRDLSASDLATRFGFEANIDFANEKMIRSVMVTEDQWFVTSASKTPELMYQSGQTAQRVYEDIGLHGLDLRRYLAFCATFRQRFGDIPDKTYWSFLLSGSYDRSGVSIIGFDKHGVLSHHGWMKTFKAKFCGSRYAVIAPRIEITEETRSLPRARRGSKTRAGREADLDD